MEATPVETPDHLDAFTRAYLECAAWSSTNFEDEDDANGTPIDDLVNDGEAEWSPEAIASAVADCADFQEANREDLDEVSDTFHVDDAQHGHDFWLTRNGHGAGFWDRGYGPLGDKLSKAAKVYGSVDLYVTAGKVYST